MLRARKILLLQLLVIICLTLASGCLSHPRVETLLHESPRGTVSLKEFPQESIEATHPVSIKPMVLMNVLNGLRVIEQKTLIDSTLTGEAMFVPVFTPSEAEFLAPLLADALVQSTAVEQVRFRLEGSDSGFRVTRAGALYVTEGDVNLFLTEYGRRPQRPPTLSRPSQSFDRPKRWTLTFVPEEAVVSRGIETVVPADGAESGVLVISLHVLERAPARKRRAPSDLRETGRDPVVEEPTKDSEAMEEDLRRLRRSLEEQEERLEQLEEQLEKR